MAQPRPPGLDSLTTKFLGVLAENRRLADLGGMIDAFDAHGAFWVAAGLTFLGFLVAMVFRGAHPDLRGRDSSPIPDTEPIQTMRP